MRHAKRVFIARALRRQDTWAERLMWQWLRDRRFSAYKFRRQHAFGPYILDLFCVEAFLEIELDGSQHGSPDGWELDAERDAWLERRGVKVMRFWNSRLRSDRRIVREAIWRVLQERVAQAVPDYWRVGGDRAEHCPGEGGI